MERNKEDLPHFFPVLLEVKAHETYRWCGCGLTQTLPLCDRMDCQQSVTYYAEHTDTVVFCGCKQTKNPPFCDGSHGELLKAYLKDKNRA